MPATVLLKSLGVLVATALCIFQPAQAQGVRISGLLPFEEGVNGEATPVVNAGTLEIPLGGRSLRIAPWPAFLPQAFAPQYIDARRQPSPAGPSDRLSMRAVEGGAAWLELATGARISTSVVGGWKLRHTARGWWLSQGSKLHFLGQDRERARPVMVASGRERWCVHLLDENMTPERHGGKTEDEAQAAWVALRTSANKRCSMPGSNTQPSSKKVHPASTAAS